MTKVFVNGNWIGLTSDAYRLFTDFQNLRRDSEIKREISIVRDFSKREIARHIRQAAYRAKRTERYAESDDIFQGGIALASSKGLVLLVARISM